MAEIRITATRRLRTSVALCMVATALMAASPAPADALPLSKDNVALSLDSRLGTKATLDYRLAPGISVDRVSAKGDGVALPLAGVATYPWRGAVTAVMVLIDTSASRRPATIRRNISDLSSIIASAPPRVHIGLATFDAGMRVLARPGAPRNAVLAALGTVSAKGQITELYRAVGEAVALLAGVPADRRAVMILSDGGAEDTAYTLEGVVAAARKAHVAIIGLGFPERPDLAVQLQSLRRLADETMGVFINAGPEHTLRAAFMAAPFAGIETGGRFTIDLAPVGSPWRAKTLSINVTLARGGKTVTLPLSVTVTRLPFTPGEKAGGAAGGLAMVLSIGLLTVRRQRKRRAALPRPIARLDFLDADGRSMPLTATQTTLGRRGDNDIQLGNETVSEHHAVLQRRRDGTFEILDLASTNGVEVNGQLVERADLADGDLVALGEARFRFNLLPVTKP